MCRQLVGEQEEQVTYGAKYRFVKKEERSSRFMGSRHSLGGETEARRDWQGWMTGPMGGS